MLAKYRALLEALLHFTELVVYFSIILVDYFSIILYNLNEYDVKWFVIANGDTLKSGNTIFNIPYGKSKSISVQIGKYSTVNENDVYLRISFRLKENTLWAEKGYEIGFEQLQIKKGLPHSTNKSKPLKSVIKDGNKILTSGQGFDAIFDMQAATLSSLKYGGEEMLVSSPIFQGYRSPVDNDKGFGNWLAKDWKQQGLDSLQRVVNNCEVIQETSDFIKIKTTVSNLSKNGNIEHTAIWTINGNGSIDIENSFTQKGQLPELPRLGIVMPLNQNLEQFEWYGHGPYENYSDRKESSPIGLYRSTVTDQYIPYPRPQDTGNKENVEWLKLTDKKGKGIQISCTSGLMSASALHFTASDFDNASHAYLLKPRKETILSLDAIMLGLGNSSCGPGVLKKYAIEKRTYNLNISIKPENK